MNWPTYGKTALRDSDEVDHPALSCRNLLCPHSSVEPVWRLSVPMSVMIFGNKFEEKSLLQEECSVVGEVIKILPYKRDGLCVKLPPSTLYRWLGLEEP